MWLKNNPKDIRFRNLIKKHARHTHVWSVGLFSTYIKNVFLLCLFFFFLEKQSHAPNKKENLFKTNSCLFGLFFFTVPLRSIVPLGINDAAMLGLRNTSAGLAGDVPGGGHV